MLLELTTGFSRIVSTPLGTRFTSLTNLVSPPANRLLSYLLIAKLSSIGRLPAIRLSLLVLKVLRMMLDVHGVRRVGVPTRCVR